MTRPYVQDSDFTLYVGDVRDVLAGLPDGCVDCVVTSPPYLDARPEVPGFHDWVWFFAEVRRICVGPALVNVGRRFNGRAEVLWWADIVAQAEPWKLLDTLIWVKPNGNPIHGEVFADRHEYVLVLGEPGVPLNVDAIRVPYAASSVSRMRRGWRNHTGVKNDTGRRAGRRQSEPHPLGGLPPSYVTVHTGGEKGNAHPTPMPLALAEHLVALASWPGQTVLDPFAGSGTTAIAARRLGRHSIGIELNEEYARMCAQRLQQLSLLAEGAA